MNASAHAAQISAREWSIRQVLTNAKYRVDYYQREYAWGTKQVQELLEDLSSRFLRSFDPSHERTMGAKYGPYFLGSIVVSDRDGKDYIVDGQQRLTTLSLLFLYLHRHPDLDEDERSNLKPLIYSSQHGKKSFNLDVEEREPLLNALFEGRSYDPDGQPEAVVNMAERFADLEELFPPELTGATLPYFVDWLTERVFLVKIVATDDEDAYTIFETMNDRGLPLNPVDMLKGYLLANIRDVSKRTKANELWRERIQEVARKYREAEHDFLKAWLRGQYAQTIRASMSNSAPGDYDRIGSEFHRWVKDVAHPPKAEEDNLVDLGLDKSEDFFRWIQNDFEFYSRWFLRFLKACETLTPGLEAIYYNSQANLTLQPMLLLAAIRPGEGEEVIQRKWRIVSIALDIWITRRVWGQSSIAQRMVKTTMFEWTKLVRGKTAEELASVLHGLLAASPPVFGPWFSLNQQNRRGVHRILARITDWVDVGSNAATRYVEYTTGTKDKAYEVEHIWADKPDRHIEEFPAAADFRTYRNRIGGLLLVPKKFNASYGALPYEEKRPKYFGQNALAKSLDPQAYDHNPSFIQFVQHTGLPFKPHPSFQKADFDERGVLLQSIALQIWNPDILLKEAHLTP